MVLQIELVALSLGPASVDGDDGHSRYTGQATKADCNLIWLEITEFSSTKSVWGVKQDHRISPMGLGFGDYLLEVQR